MFLDEDKRYWLALKLGLSVDIFASTFAAHGRWVIGASLLALYAGSFILYVWVEESRKTKRRDRARALVATKILGRTL
jgi:hypothetical protein